MALGNEIAAPPGDHGDLEVIRDGARLAALHDLGLLDTSADEAFDRLTRLGAVALGVPVSLVSLVDADRQFFLSQKGLAEPYASTLSRLACLW